MQKHLGIVQKGLWNFLAPETGKNPTRRLTQVAIQEARSPESGEMDLSEYEGCLLLVEGRENGDWICSAQVVDQCDAAMSEAVLALLASRATTAPTQQPDSAESLQSAYDALNRELAPLMANGSGTSASDDQRLAALSDALARVNEAAQLLQVPVR